MKIKVYRDKKYCFEIDCRSRVVLLPSGRANIRSRAFDVLVHLAQNSGKILKRRDIIEYIWRNGAVEENNLNVQIASLRRELGSEIISTAAGRGYVFTPTVEIIKPNGDDDYSLEMQTNLPVSIPRIIGRRLELGKLSELFKTKRMVTIVGPGGIGKTLLAQWFLKENIEQVKHGVCFVDLSAIQPDTKVDQVIAAALSLKSPSEFTSEILAKTLATANLILVLDSCERHTVEAYECVTELINKCPGVLILNTSQVPLGHFAESVIRLGPLEVPSSELSTPEVLKCASVELFLESAKMADASFEVSDAETSKIVEVSRITEGIPLSIHLVARQTPALGLNGILKRLKLPLTALISDSKMLPSRLQSLRNALSWSYSLLGERQKYIFRQISLFPTHFNIEVLASYISKQHTGNSYPPEETVSHLLYLVDRSLVFARNSNTGDVRYGLLEGARSFATELLASSCEDESAKRAFIDAHVEKYREAYDLRYSGNIDVSTWIKTYENDLQNGLTALKFAEAANDYEACVSILPGLLASSSKLDKQNRKDLVALAIFCSDKVSSNLSSISGLLEAARSVFSFDNAMGQYLTFECLGKIETPQGQFIDDRLKCQVYWMQAMSEAIGNSLDSARKYLDKASKLENRDWPAALRVLRYPPRFWIADRNGDGLELYEISLQAVSHMRASGHPTWAEGHILVNGAMAANLFDIAILQGSKAIEFLEQGRDFSPISDIRNQLIGAFSHAGKLEEARKQSLLSWPFAGNFDRLDVWADYHSLLMAKEGDFSGASKLIGFSDYICKKSGIIRTRNEQFATDVAKKICIEQIGLNAFERAKEIGSMLDTIDIGYIAFGEAF